MLNLSLVEWKKYRQASNSEWQSLSNLQINTVFDSITSIGFLIDESANQVVLASSMLNDTVSGLFAIPKSDIISIKNYDEMILNSIEDLKGKNRDLNKYNKVLLAENTHLKTVNEKLVQKAKLNTVTGKMAYDSENLKEIPKEFYGINVDDFIKVYPTSTYAEMSKLFNTNNMVITSLVNLLVRFGKIERHPRCNWRRNLSINTLPKAVKGKSFNSILKEERDTMTEVPEVFHGIPVNDFIENYKNMSFKTITKHYGVGSNTISALIHILVRLGKVEKRNHLWRAVEDNKVTTLKNNNPKISFKDSVNLDEFKKDFLNMPMSDMVKKYGVSDYTIYTTGAYYGFERNVGRSIKNNTELSVKNKQSRENPQRIILTKYGVKTKIQTLMEKKKELIELCNSKKTQNEMAKIYNVSSYTIGTVLHRLGLHSGGMNGKLIYRK